MKATTIVAALVVLAIGADNARAQSVEDYHAELKEWVYGPCMEIGAALAVGTLDKKTRELGVKREHVAKLMLASRDGTILDFAKTLAGGSKSPNWEARRKFYPPLLRLCVQQQLKKNASAQPIAASPPARSAGRHEIPVCGAEMARANFEARFCPSPWTEIWSTDFVGTYRQVWHCAESNSQYGTFLNAKGCGSAWLPKGYSKVR